MSSKFNIVKKGYSPIEVEEFLKATDKKNEQNILENREKQNKLKDEIEKLKKELNVYKEKENIINKALIMATEKAEEIENALYKKLKLEEERLLLFQNKWQTFSENQLNSKEFIKQKHILEAYLKNAHNELLNGIAKHFTISNSISPMETQYINECKRLTALNYKNDIYENKNSIKNSNENENNINIINNENKFKNENIFNNLDDENLNLSNLKKSINKNINTEKNIKDLKKNKNVLSSITNENTFDSELKKGFNTDATLEQLCSELLGIDI